MGACPDVVAGNGTIGVEIAEDLPDVDTVVVDGRVLMQGRVVRSVDERAVLDGALAASRLAMQRSGLDAMQHMPANLWGRSRF